MDGSTRVHATSKEFKYYVNKIKLAHQMLGKPLKKYGQKSLK